MIGIDRIFQRNRLRILHIDCLAFGQTAFIGIGNFFGAFLRAGVAGNALVHIDVARVLSQFDFEIALLAADALDFRKRQQFDVDVPADLDQFGRYDSHRTVIGWKGFIKLRHHAADRA